jgi:NTP pyrophosphatase (non-canonical NTP hydrolase)
MGAFMEYESEAARTINGSLGANERMLDAAAGLAEEAGEVLGIVRKQVNQGRAMDRERLKEELGDALWCIAMVAREAGLGLEEVVEANIEKLRGRYPDGFKSGKDGHR